MYVNTVVWCVGIYISTTDTDAFSDLHLSQAPLPIFSLTFSKSYIALIPYMSPI